MQLCQGDTLGCALGMLTPAVPCSELSYVVCTSGVFTHAPRTKYKGKGKDWEEENICKSVPVTDVLGSYFVFLEIYFSFCNKIISQYPHFILQHEELGTAYSSVSRKTSVLMGSVLKLLIFLYINKQLVLMCHVLLLNSITN